MKTINIEDATRQQLYRFLTEQKGVEVKWEPKTTRASLVAELTRIGYDKETILVADEVDAAEGVKTSRKSSKSESDIQTVVIERTEGQGGGDKVVLSVNGSAILVPRGQEVPLHKKFVEVLRNAVTTVMSQAPDGEIIQRDIPTYPFRVVAA